MTTLEKMTAKARVKKELLEGLQRVIDGKRDHLNYISKEYASAKALWEEIPTEDREGTFEEYWKRNNHWDYDDWRETTEYFEVVEEVVKELVK